MVRVLLYVILVFLLAIGFAWLAERPGDILLHWQGYEIRTSLMVAAMGLIVVIAAIALLGALVKAIVNAPTTVGAFLGARRRDRGYRALSTGLIAVGSGDVRTARRSADDLRARGARDADVIREDAREQAAGIIREAEQEVERLKGEYHRLRDLGRDMRAGYRAFLLAALELVESTTPAPGDEAETSGRAEAASQPMLANEHEDARTPEAEPEPTSLDSFETARTSS